MDAMVHQQPKEKIPMTLNPSPLQLYGHFFWKRNLPQIKTIIVYDRLLGNKKTYISISADQPLLSDEFLKMLLGLKPKPHTLMEILPPQQRALSLSTVQCIRESNKTLFSLINFVNIFK